MAEGPDECMECGALTNRMPKHKRWHEQINAGLVDPPARRTRPARTGPAAVVPAALPVVVPRGSSTYDFPPGEF